MSKKDYGKIMSMMNYYTILVLKKKLNTEVDKDKNKNSYYAWFDEGSYVKFSPKVPSNGGGKELNVYTLILDLAFERFAEAYLAVYQTSVDNSNDAECYLRTADSESHTPDLPWYCSRAD